MSSAMLRVVMDHPHMRGLRTDSSQPIPVAAFSAFHARTISYLLFSSLAKPL